MADISRSEFCLLQRLCSWAVFLTTIGRSRSLLRMETPTLRTLRLALLLGLVYLTFTPLLPAALAPDVGAIEELGDGTLRITCSGKSKFTRNTVKLKDAATAEATRYCQELGKYLKIISTSERKGMYLVGEMPSFTLVFRPVDFPDTLKAENSAVPVTESGDFHTMLLKLDDLRKKGILTDDEFQTEKRKILGRLK